MKMHFTASARGALLAGVFVAAAGLLAGCASNSASPKSDEQQVSQRSDEFWVARLTHQAEKAYQYTPPSYRQIKDLERFRFEFSGLPVTGARTLESVSCNEARCVAKHKLVTSSPLSPNLAVPVYLEEIWIKEDGQWWIFQR
jgi:hypothetical protein